MIKVKLRLLTSKAFLLLRPLLITMKLKELQIRVEQMTRI